jgi:hypothetical protein
MWCLVHIGAQSMICFQFSSILIKFLGLLLKLQPIWMTCWLSRQVSLLPLFSNHNVKFTWSFFTSSDGRGVPRASIGGAHFTLFLLPLFFFFWVLFFFLFIIHYWKLLFFWGGVMPLHPCWIRFYPLAHGRTLSAAIESWFGFQFHRTNTKFIL